MKILHLGCGRKKHQGAIGVDVTTNSAADVVYDLNRGSWPFTENTLDKFYCIDIIEHVDDVIAFLNEIYRIGKAGAEVVIQAPFASSHFVSGDPTHKRGFTSKSFKYFDQNFDDTYFHYSTARFQTLEITYNKYEKWVWTYRPKLVDRILLGLANRHKDLYERRFMWIYPVQTIYVRLKIMKNGTTAVV